MKIIVNADDMGYTKGVSEGIVEGYEKGVITSTTVMCNMPYAENVPALLKGHDGLGVGVHLTLTCGAPLTNPKTLVNNNGQFLKCKEFYEKKVDAEEVYQEFKAQIERFIQLFRCKPTHMDSHQGVIDGISILLKEQPALKAAHNTDEILDVSMRLAKEYALPVRRHCGYKWIEGYHGKNATGDTFVKLIENNKEHDLEFMVHPGYCDLELYTVSSYNLDRVKELDGLCSQKVTDYIKNNQIELVHF